MSCCACFCLHNKRLGLSGRPKKLLVKSKKYIYQTYFLKFFSITNFPFRLVKKLANCQASQIAGDGRHQTDHPFLLGLFFGLDLDLLLLLLLLLGGVALALPLLAHEGHGLGLGLGLGLRFGLGLRLGLELGLGGLLDRDGLDLGLVVVGNQVSSLTNMVFSLVKMLDNLLRIHIVNFLFFRPFSKYFRLIFTQPNFTIFLNIEIKKLGRKSERQKIEEKTLETFISHVGSHSIGFFFFSRAQFEIEHGSRLTQTETIFSVGAKDSNKFQQFSIKARLFK